MNGETQTSPKDQQLGAMLLKGESIAQHGSVYETLINAGIPALKEKFSGDELLRQSQAIFDAYIAKRTGEFDVSQDPVYIAFHKGGILVRVPEWSNKAETPNLQHAYYADGMGYLWNFYHKAYQGSAEGDEETREEKLLRDQVRHLAVFVTSNDVEQRFIHSTGLEQAEQIIETGLKTPGGDLLATARYAPRDRNHALDSLLSAHEGAEMAVVVGIPMELYKKYRAEIQGNEASGESVFDQLFDPEQMNRGKFVLRKEFIKGYVNRKTKKFVSA